MSASLALSPKKSFFPDWIDKFPERHAEGNQRAAEGMSPGILPSIRGIMGSVSDTCRNLFNVGGATTRLATSLPATISGYALRTGAVCSDYIERAAFIANKCTFAPVSNIWKKINEKVFGVCYPKLQGAG